MYMLVLSAIPSLLSDVPEFKCHIRCDALNFIDIQLDYNLNWKSRQPHVYYQSLHLVQDCPWINLLKSILQDW